MIHTNNIVKHWLQAVVKLQNVNISKIFFRGIRNFVRCVRKACWMITVTQRRYKDGDRALILSFAPALAKYTFPSKAMRLIPSVMSLIYYIFPPMFQWSFGTRINCLLPYPLVDSFI